MRTAAGSGRERAQTPDMGASMTGAHTAHTDTPGSWPMAQYQRGFACFTDATTAHASIQITYSLALNATTARTWHGRVALELSIVPGKSTARRSLRMTRCERYGHLAKRGDRWPQSLGLASPQCHWCGAANPGPTSNKYIPPKKKPLGNSGGFFVPKSGVEMKTERLSQEVLDFTNP